MNPRRVRRSRNYLESFQNLLEQGLPKYGVRVVEAKRAIVDRLITEFLSRHPRRPIDPVLGLYTYPVSGTPFLLIYDFDDDELRLHLVVHVGMERSGIDLSDIQW